jgi:arylsulfatase
MHVELYDLDRDIKEEKNVSEAEPKLVKKMENIMRKEHVPSPIDRFKMKQLGDE